MYGYWFGFILVLKEKNISPRDSITAIVNYYNVVRPPVDKKKPQCVILQVWAIGTMNNFG